MEFAVTSDGMLETFGLAGVVFFLSYESEGNQLDRRTAEFLSRVGLPDNQYFMAKASVGQEESIRLESWFGSERGTLPQECREWLVLGHFVASLIALDPVSGKVYAFGEGEPLDAYEHLHRDVESLAYALYLFGKFEEEGDEEEVEQRVERLRSRIEAFDPLPFADEQSQWNLIFEEVIDGIW